MKFGFWLIITTGVAVASAFTKDTGHMLALVVLMSVWLLIGVPIGMWLLKLAKASSKPEPEPKQLTELEQLWMEVGPPDQPMAHIWNPPSHPH